MFKVSFVALHLLLIARIEMRIRERVPDGPIDAFCLQLSTLEYFDLSRFVGHWFEISAYPDALTAGGSCVVSSYAFSNNMNVTIFNKFVNKDGYEIRLIGMAAETSESVFDVTFSAAPELNAIFYILNTDYENFSVVASCNEARGVIDDFNLWVLSRTRDLDQRFFGAIRSTFRDNRLSESLLMRTNQACDYRFMF